MPLLDPSNIRDFADLCDALSDPTRLLIFSALIDQARSVAELQSLLGLSQTAVSHHLKILKARRIIDVKRQKRSNVYAVTPQVTHTSATITVALPTHTLTVKRR